MDAEDDYVHLSGQGVTSPKSDLGPTADTPNENFDSLSDSLTAETPIEAIPYVQSSALPVDVPYPTISSAAVHAPVYVPPPPIEAIGRSQSRVGRQPSGISAATAASPKADAPITPLTACCSITWWTRNVLPALSWEDPLKTAALFLAGVTVFVVFGVLRVRPVAFTAQTFLFTAVATGLYTVATHHSSAPAGAVQQWLTNLPSAANVPRAVAGAVEYTLTKAIAMAQKVLSWSSPMESLRAMAVVWLVSHHWCLLFGKVTLFLAFVSAFTLPLAYGKAKASIDAVLNKHAVPVLTKAASFATEVQNKTTLTTGLPVVVFGAVLWFVIAPIGIWFSLVSAAFLLVQVLPQIKPKAN